MKFVSVIIPCRNEAAFIGPCLDSILDSDYPAGRMEVIVADGMSTDGTRALVERYAARDTRVRLIDNAERITPAGLNRAIEAARGDVIARVDAHARLAADYLSRCIFYLDTTGADNAGGAMRTVAQADGPFAAAIVAALTHPFGVGNSHFRTGSARVRWVDTVFGGCWRREVFERVGMFNEQLERSQDMEFSLRLKAAGGRTLLAPDVRSEYFARSDWQSFWRHNFLNGEWAVLPFLYSDVIPVRARHLIPLLFVLGLMMGAIGLLWTPWVLAMIAIPYAAVNLAASVHAAFSKTSGRSRRVSLMVKMPLVFASLHVAYGAGSLSGLAKLAARWAGMHDRRRPAESASNRDRRADESPRRRTLRGSDASAGGGYGQGSH